MKDPPFPELLTFAQILLAWFTTSFRQQSNDQRWPSWRPINSTIRRRPLIGQIYFFHCYFRNERQVQPRNATWKLQRKPQPPSQKVSPPPTAEMTEAATKPTKVCDVTLNALLIEPIPLAFLETVAPGNNFVSLNNQAAALISLSNLP